MALSFLSFTKNIKVSLRFFLVLWAGNPDNLTPEQKDTVNVVCDAYSHLNPQQLSDLTHSEAPFINARKGLAPNERGHNVISLADMAEFYESLHK